MTTVAPETVHVDLSARDLEILLESLQHCLATCHQKDHDPKAKCPDCDAAKALQHRLQKAGKG